MLETNLISLNGPGWDPAYNFPPTPNQGRVSQKPSQTFLSKDSFYSHQNKQE